MRLRQRRGTGGNRKAIGAAVIGGVLLVAGATGVQFASAGETTKAGNIVVVNGQNFDVADCRELEIQGADVICDGAALAPEEEAGAGAGQAADAAAQALEAACDDFAADQAAAEEQADAEQAAAEEQAGAQKTGAQQTGTEAKPASKKLKKANSGAWGAAGADDKAEAEEAVGADDAAEGAAGAEDAAAAIEAGQLALQQACLELADAKAAGEDGAEAGAADQQAGADEADEAGVEQEVGGQQKSTKTRSHN